MNKSEYQIVSIPDKFIIDKNAIYEFGIGLSNENALITDNEIKVQLVLKEQLDKYKNVIDKIKEEVLSELQMCKPKDMAISMEINYIDEKLEKLFEEVNR